MAAVVGVVKEHLRSKSSHRRTRSSIDACAPPNQAILDGPFLRGRGTSLRQQALAEEAEDLVVSSPKDKKFESVPWEAMSRQHPDFFSPNATPVSDGPKTPTSAEYVNFHDSHTFQHPRPAPTTRGHRRTISTPSVNTECTSAGRRPSIILKRRPMPLSKSEPSPASPSFPTISELYDNISKTQDAPPIDKPLPAEPVAEIRRDLQATAEQLNSSNKPVPSVPVVASHPPRRDSLQSRERPHFHLPPDTEETYANPIKRPTHIDMPRRLNLPSELHVHTPEYTEALKQWFPNMKTPTPKAKRNAVAGFPGISVAV